MFPKIIREYRRKTYAVTALQLQGMRIVPQEESHKYEHFSNTLLDKQMDFIHSLQTIPEDFSIELRYLSDPAEPHNIRIYFLLKVSASKPEEIENRSEQMSRHMLNLLMINNPYHEFRPVADEKELRYLYEPFEINHIAEIVRREDLIGLDAMRKKTTRPMGFDSEGTPCNPQGTEIKLSQIYYIFPFTFHLDNMERVCSVLFLQHQPCLLSVCLRPYQMNPKDENHLEGRIKSCEKYSQLSIGMSDDVEKLEPFLKMQATTLFKNCAKEFLALQDASFLMKIQMASPAPVPFDLWSVVGSTITAPTGQLSFGSLGALENAFVGGYDLAQPRNKREKTRAISNLKNMEFEVWIPSIADAGTCHWRYLFDVQQANTAFRLPLPTTSEFPGIETIQYQVKTAPSDLPTSGLLIGEHLYLNQKRKVYFTPQDRRKHAYVVGATGTGKSTLFESMIVQDMQNGQGVGVIDPHGDLIENILDCIPPGREKDVILFDPQDTDWPPGINLLECRTVYEKDFSINYLMEVFDQLYDLKQTGGPIFEMYMRNALQLLLDQPEGFKPTIADLPRVFQSYSYRRSLLEKCKNAFVVNFWKEEAEKAGGDASLVNITPYITSKFTRFIYNESVRRILGQRGSTIDFRKAIDAGKILLVNICKGFLGETNSYFLGMLIVGKLFTATLSRATEKDRENLKDFYLYVDEFQNLATPTFVAILSEARKYGLSLTLTNQYTSQLKDNILRGIQGNVGTLISFRVGANDAEILSKEFSKAITENDLIGLSNWHAYVRLLINGNVNSPFNMRTILPEKTPRPEIVPQIWDHSRKNYARPLAEVEAEILEAWITKKRQEPEKDILKTSVDQANNQWDKEEEKDE